MSLDGVVGGLLRQADVLKNIDRRSGGGPFNFEGWPNDPGAGGGRFEGWPQPPADLVALGGSEGKTAQASFHLGTDAIDPNKTKRGHLQIQLPAIRANAYSLEWRPQ